MTPEQLRVVGELRALAESGRARTLRVQQRIGLRELARSIQASPSAVSRWEHGRHSPRGSVALRWATALGLMERAAEVQATTAAEEDSTALEVQSGASATGNDNAAGVQPTARVEQVHASRQ